MTYPTTAGAWKVGGPLLNNGLLLPNVPAYSTFATLIANRAYFRRFVPPQDMTLTKFGLHFATAASANDAFDFGIYDSAGSRLYSLGATTGFLNLGTGTRQVAVSYALTAGTVYYAGMSIGTIGGTGAAVSTDALTNTGDGLRSIMGTAVPAILSGYIAGAHPLPSSMTAISGGIANVPCMALRTD